MKKLFLLLVVINCKSLYAQSSKELDSLKVVVANAKNDKDKIAALTILADSYSDYNSDSGFHYTYLLKDAAVKAQDKSAEAYAIGDLGYGFLHTGNLVQALALSFDALKRFEILKDSVNIANTYNGIGHVYRAQRNDTMALLYYYKTYQLAHSIKDYRDEVFGAVNLSGVYLSKNQLDSALFYGELALNTLDTRHVVYSRAGLLLSLSYIYNNMHQQRLGDSLLREALNIATQTGDIHLSSIEMNYASKLLERGNSDSALYYANKVRNELAKNAVLAGKFELYTLFAQVYAAQSRFDSAYMYVNKSIVVKDSLFNAAQIQQSANLAFNERQRETDLKNTAAAYKNKLKLYAALSILALALISLFFLFSRNKKQQKANRLLQKQKQQIQETLQELKSTQQQLIQSEKMASLGELTAGIAHEIQNPLNFVNNFSDVNKELLEELKDEADKGNIDEVKSIANDVIENSEKINHHGKRADSIVKGMLEHSRTSTGQKELTDINKLADEYLRLAYHGLRAKDKSFNTEIKTDFDEAIGKINIASQDIGRVLLNLYNNAFYAVNEKRATHHSQLTTDYKPLVSVQTKKLNGRIEISVSDNGNGIPQNIVDKIFQPFFTTKPTGQGTGLGLSLAYDIIKAHGGEIKVETKQGKSVEFLIQLPAVNY